MTAVASSMPGTRAAWKQAAAERATECVRSGMTIGLGAGSTALLAVRQIGALIARGTLTNIVGVPCSREVGDEATRLGIALTTLEDRPSIDLTIDGADQVDPLLSLIKGRGGALLHEKIVAQASRREIIVVDASKVSPVLGMACPVPVEVLPFGWRTQAAFLEGLGARVQVREGEPNTPFRTEDGNLILDCTFGPIRSPRELSRMLSERAGVVEHGLFVDLVTDLVVAAADGTHHYTREGTRRARI